MTGVTVTVQEMNKHGKPDEFIKGLLLKNENFMFWVEVAWEFLDSKGHGQLCLTDRGIRMIGVSSIDGIWKEHIAFSHQGIEKVTFNEGIIKLVFIGEEHKEIIYTCKNGNPEKAFSELANMVIAKHLELERKNARTH